MPPAAPLTCSNDSVFTDLTDACDLTLDQDTAYNDITVSADKKRATHGACQPYPDLPQRFDHHRHVLCKEGLTGRHYWEVEWTKGSNGNGIAVTYKGIVRKGSGSEAELGANLVSWFFGMNNGLNAWHNGKIWTAPVPSTGCDRVGVFLDWPAGSLSFYIVSHNSLRHMYTFRNRFTEPLFPAFQLFHSSNYVALCTDL